MSKEKIIVRPGFGEIKIAFDDNLFNVKKKDIEERIDALKLKGAIVDADLSYFDSGIITLIYNPTRANASAARTEAAANDLASFIETFAVEP
ncbi:hypothetical protein IKQ38_02255 [Candidatus Saccharibacteria bacterium]|nr:hypothetical protein [Candidatus Saccharibacteria bacterium]